MPSPAKVAGSAGGPHRRRSEAVQEQNVRLAGEGTGAPSSENPMEFGDWLGPAVWAVPVPEFGGPRHFTANENPMASSPDAKPRSAKPLHPAPAHAPAAPDEARPERPLSDRLTWKPGTLLSPVPVVLVTSGGGGEPPNVATVAWAGTVCSDPCMLSISLRAATSPTAPSSARASSSSTSPPRASSGRWTSAASSRAARATSFPTAGLTPVPATQVKAPIVAECPIALECRVRQTLELGLHRCSSPRSSPCRWRAGSQSATAASP